MSDVYIYTIITRLLLLDLYHTSNVTAVSYTAAQALLAQLQSGILTAPLDGSTDLESTTTIYQSFKESVLVYV